MLSSVKVVAERLSRREPALKGAVGVNILILVSLYGCAKIGHTFGQNGCQI